MSTNAISLDTLFMFPTTFVIVIDKNTGSYPDEELQQQSAPGQVLNADGEHYSPRALYRALHSEKVNHIPTKLLVPVHLASVYTEEHNRKLYDSTGATLLHQLLKHEKWELFKWTVNNFPDFGLVPYRLYNDNGETLPYGGQNILHLAVYGNQYDRAKWILDFYSRHSDSSLRELLLGRVNTQDKSFFNRRGGSYFGETPLQFAVSLGDTNMVDLILSFASMSDPTETNVCGIPARNILFYPDCNGNTLVHLCAIHGNVQMFEHIKYLALEMLQQEVMTVLHHCMTLTQLNPDDSISLQTYRPSPVNYAAVFYANKRPFTFQGYHRKLPFACRQCPPKHNFLKSKCTNTWRR
jgi:hypothetical protein